MLTLGGLTLENSTFKRAKPLLLLAYLALEGAKERRFLRELLWRDAKDSHNSLGTALARLRGSGAGVVGSDEIRAWCETQCDATQLLTAVDEDDNQRVVELYRGPFLEGVDPSAAGIEIEEWIYSTREALGTRVRQALLNLGGDHAGVGEFSLGAELAQRAYSLPGAPEPMPDELERLFVLLTAVDHHHLSWVMANLGDFLFNHRLFDEGKGLLKESLELARESGSGAEVTPLDGLTEAALVTGDLDEAEGYASELLQVSKDNWFTMVESDALMLLGVIATRRGHIREAEVFLVEALQIASRIETMETSLGVLVAAAGLRVAQGHVAATVEWLSFSIDHLVAEQFSRFEAQRLLDGLHDQLPPAEFTAAVERGKESSLEEMFNEILPAR